MPSMSQRQVFEERIDSAFNAIVRVHRSAEILDDQQLMDDCSRVLRWLAEAEKTSVMRALGQTAPPSPPLDQFRIPF